MDNKKKIKNYKYFFVSMCISGMVILLIIGLVTTEYNIHNMLLGNKEPFFEYNVSDHKFVKFIFFGQSIKLDFNFFHHLLKQINVCKIIEFFKHKIV